LTTAATRAGCGTTGGCTASGSAAAGALREQLSDLGALGIGDRQFFLNVRSVDELKAAAAHAHLHAHTLAAAATLSAGPALSAGAGALGECSRASDSECEYKDSFHVLVFPPKEIRNKITCAAV
jgi:hypothetical protein